MNNLIEKNRLVEVAAAVLLREGNGEAVGHPVAPPLRGQKPYGFFLLAQRPSDKIWAGYWEFPGGKIEHGETPRHALVRELREELGIEVETAYPWVTRVFTYPHATVRLNFFRVTKWSGELHPHEGQEFAWQRISNISGFSNPPFESGLAGMGGLSPNSQKGERRGDFAHDEICDERPFLHDAPNYSLTVYPILPTNAPILRALELPSLYAVSNVAELGAEEFMRRLKGALHNGLRLVQVREKNLLRAEMRALSLRVLELAHAYGARVLINSDIELAQGIGADGVHLTSTQLAALRERPDLPWCAASCHNATELQRAGELDMDFAVLGPVLPTRSHPGAAHFGWEVFGEIAAGSAIPVYALGGLCRDDMETAWQRGAHGIALLRQAW